MVMLNNTPETVTKQQSYHENETEKSAHKKVNNIMKEEFKILIVINTEDYLKRRKQTKRIYEKLVSVYLYRRQIKNKKTEEKSNSWYSTRSITTTNKAANRAHAGTP